MARQFNNRCPICDAMPWECEHTIEEKFRASLRQERMMDAMRDDRDMQRRLNGGR